MMIAWNIDLAPAQARLPRHNGNNLPVITGKFYYNRLITIA